MTVPLRLSVSCAVRSSLSAWLPTSTNGGLTPPCPRWASIPWSTCSTTTRAPRCWKRPGACPEKTAGTTLPRFCILQPCWLETTGQRPRWTPRGDCSQMGVRECPVSLLEAVRLLLGKAHPDATALREDLARRLVAYILAERKAAGSPGLAPASYVHAVAAGPPRYGEPDAWPAQRVLAFGKATLDFARTRLPYSFLAQAYVHQDGAAPYIRLTCLPVGPTGRLGWNAVRPDLPGANHRAGIEGAAGQLSRGCRRRIRSGSRRTFPMVSREGVARRQAPVARRAERPDTFPENLPARWPGLWPGICHVPSIGMLAGRRLVARRLSRSWRNLPPTGAKPAPAAHEERFTPASDGYPSAG